MSIYDHEYDNVGEMLEATLYHKQRPEPPFVCIYDLMFLRIPKNASRAMLLIGLPFYLEPKAGYAVIRNPVDRFISAWNDKPCWRDMDISSFVDVVAASDRQRIDVHLRGQLQIAGSYKTSWEFVDYSRLGIDLLPRLPKHNVGEGKPEVNFAVKRRISDLYDDDMRLWRRLNR